MSVARALAANTAVQIAGKVVSTVLGVFVVAAITRLLGTEGFGAYSIANAFLQVFAIILDMGLNVMIVQMLGEHAGETAFENRIVSAIYSLRFWSALIILSLAPLIGLLTTYSWDIKMAFFAIWASFFFTTLNQIVIGVQQRHLKMHIVATAEVVGRIVLLGGIMFATAMGWGLIPVVLIVSLAGTANFIVNFLFARRYASFKIGFDWPLWKQTIHRAWPIGVSVICSLIYFKSDTLILSRFRPVAEVGIYGAAYRVLEILVTFPFMYAGILLPLIANAWTFNERERFGRLIGRSFDAFMLLTCPVVAGILLIADKAMILVAGQDFAASGNVLRILVLAVASIYLGTIFNYATVALNLQRRMLKYYGLVAGVTLALYMLLIPEYGMWAAAWLTVFSEVSVAVICLILTLKTSGMTLSFSIPAKAIAASSVMYITALPLARGSIAITIVVAVSVYAFLLFIMRAIPKDMIVELLAIRKKNTE